MLFSGLEIANMDRPLVTLRKRSSSVSQTHRATQRSASVQVVRAAMARVLGADASAGPTAAHVKMVSNPSTLASAEDAHAVFKLIQDLESAFLSGKSGIWGKGFGDTDRKWIRTDATKRLGEVAVIAMQRGFGKNLWAQWVARDPKALLGRLLGVGGRPDAAIQNENVREIKSRGTTKEKNTESKD